MEKWHGPIIVYVSVIHGSRYTYFKYIYKKKQKHKRLNPITDLGNKCIYEQSFGAYYRDKVCSYYTGMIIAKTLLFIYKYRKLLLYMVTTCISLVHSAYWICKLLTAYMGWNFILILLVIHINILLSSYTHLDLN